MPAVVASGVAEFARPGQFVTNVLQAPERRDRRLQAGELLAEPPDLARVGGRYSDEWHRQHLIDPRSVVPESVMPGYEFLLDKEVDGKDIGKHLAALNLVVNNGRGAMYTEDQIANAEADFVAQATGNEADGMLERYKKAQARDYDGQGKITEMDALIAYMQMLGTLVDTSTFKAAASR